MTPKLTTTQDAQSCDRLYSRFNFLK